MRVRVHPAHFGFGRRLDRSTTVVNDLAYEVRMQLRPNQGKEPTAADLNHIARVFGNLVNVLADSNVLDNDEVRRVLEIPDDDAFDFQPS